MGIKKTIAIVAALSITASVSVTGLALEHWALAFVSDYFTIHDVSVLDEPISEAEFYTCLNECVGGISPEVAEDGMRLITRGDACIAIAQCLPEEGRQSDGHTEHAFVDSGDISPEALAGLEMLYDLGVVHGYPDGSFRPQSWLTYGEACKLFSEIQAILAEWQAQPDEVGLPEDLELRDSEPKISSTRRRGSHSTGSGTVAQAVENLRFTADMGNQFRSIDVRITAIENIIDPQVYYMVLESGSPRPDQAEIIADSGSSPARGLNGKWAASTDSGSTISIGGRSAAGEDGLIDGVCYDIYMVAVGSDGTMSEVAAVQSVMAMPFAAKGAEPGTFILKELGIDEINQNYPDLSQNSGMFYQTARQLDNIRRLAELYVESGGVHGSEEFQSGGYTYILGGDMDLKHYMTQDNESGWRPIGPFTGCLDGNGYSISGLYIDRDEPSAGLFSKAREATIRNLTLDGPIVITRDSASTERYACMGTLAGECVQSVLENITVSSPRVAVVSSEPDSMTAVGGVIGSAVNTDFSRVTVTDADITSGGWGIHGVTGGVAGRYSVSSEGKYLLRDLFVSGVVNAVGKAAGGIAGTLDAPVDKAAYVFGENIDSLVRVAGSPMYAGGIVGNVGYEALLNARARITFDNCYASGSIKAAEVAGGLFGKVNASVKSAFVAKNSASEADMLPVSEQAVLGGFVGAVHSGSFENCHSVGSGITTQGGDAGGFVGIARGYTDFIQCLTNRNVQAAASAGGFVGSQDGGVIKLYDCSAGGRVSGASVVGDFAGALVADPLATEIVNCTVRGPGASGRLVGVWR